GWVKVAWELRCEPRGEAASRILVDLRVTATDDDSWRRFRQYFALVGPFSHFIRRHLLDIARRELGAPRHAEVLQHLAGDELVPDATFEATDGVTIAATPDAIWPWLIQMGCGRAGWYSWDILDNAGERSATRVVRELQDVHVGDVLPATPRGKAGFEVLVLDPPHALVLGGLYNAETGQQFGFGQPRPADYSATTWAFVLEPLDESTTRLHVRARGTLGAKRFSASARLFFIGLIHRFMETAQLHNLKARVEGTELSGIEEKARAVWIL
ncbi:MAG: hypothetical protein JO347_02595, partial [Candidatus Eremiobacteraeota bacterium]|nr:hypothetical protein [Candidatus Eremiobacteraeota bacterium]